MRSYINAFALIFAIMAFSFISLNAQDLSGMRTENAIEREVQKKILRLPYYEVFDHIAFDVDGGTVTLTGKVRNAMNKSGAEDAAERVDGVSRVINNIEVLPVGSFDEQIRQRLYQRLSNYGSLSRYLWTVNPPVRLIVDRGHVTLEGFVANQGDYNTMNVVAHGVSGVFSVTNNLVVDSGRAR